MTEETFSPLIRSPLEMKSREDLQEFLAQPDAALVVKESSFEEVFFTIKHLGLADCLELLPLVTPRQSGGFIDLDCWRKDNFVRKPFMEWMAAFVQAGPEETVRALSGIDIDVIALFLKELLNVYELERDDPPPGNSRVTPDGMFAVEANEDADREPVSMAMLLLDAMFKSHPQLGYSVLRRVRYTTSVELEETAYENRNRRLEVHGFVDYFEAMSIYADSPGTAAAPDRTIDRHEAPGEESPAGLPALFVSSLSGGELLRRAMAEIGDPAEMMRIGQELTALGNRVLSANVTNFGDLDGVRPALEEMRDILTIGLETLCQGDLARSATVLRSNYMQSVFRKGFSRLAALRDQAIRLAARPGFRVTLLEEEDRFTLEGLRRFKPQEYASGQFSGFRNLAQVERAMSWVAGLSAMLDAFDLSRVPGNASLSQCFNTAAVRLALAGTFRPDPLESSDLESFLLNGFQRPAVDVTHEVRPFADRWLDALESEFKPLAGTRPIDVRYIVSVLVKL